MHPGGAILEAHKGTQTVVLQETVDRRNPEGEILEEES